MDGALEGDVACSDRTAERHQRAGDLRHRLEPHHPRQHGMAIERMIAEIGIAAMRERAFDDEFDAGEIDLRLVEEAQHRKLLRAQRQRRRRPEPAGDDHRARGLFLEQPVEGCQRVVDRYGVDPLRGEPLDGAEPFAHAGAAPQAPFDSERGAPRRGRGPRRGRRGLHRIGKRVMRFALQPDGADDGAERHQPPQLRSKRFQDLRQSGCLRGQRPADRLRIEFGETLRLVYGGSIDKPVAGPNSRAAGASAS